MTASSAAVPIVTDFAQKNQSIKNSDVPESRKEVAVVNPFLNLETYIQRMLKSNITENALTENAEINLDEIDDDSVSKVSKVVFENVRLIKRFAKKSVSIRY